jgi:hypothetical protein
MKACEVSESRLHVHAVSPSAADRSLQVAHHRRVARKVARVLALRCRPVVGWEGLTIGEQVGAVQPDRQARGLSWYRCDGMAFENMGRIRNTKPNLAGGAGDRPRWLEGGDRDRTDWSDPTHGWWSMRPLTMLVASHQALIHTIASITV